MLLKDKVALITGASRGIGRAIALRFAEEGCQLALCSRSQQSLEKVATEIGVKGARCICLETDVAKPLQVGQTVQKTLDTFGELDILVNNAGLAKDNLVALLSVEDWDEVLSVNLKGAYLFTKAASRWMIKKQKGRIINITSVIGLTGNAGQANYAASKAAMIGFTKSAAKELGKRGITVNAVAPGFIETDMTKDLSGAIRQSVIGDIPLGRLGDPSDVANVVLFLASHYSSYIHGQVIAVDGGMVM